MFDLPAMRAALLEFGFDGWLLHDFRGSNVLARRILELDGRPTTSRRFYLLRAGRRRADRVWSIGSRPACSTTCRGRSASTSGGRTWSRASDRSWPGRRRVAMEYSPRNNIPYISRTDAGTIEVIREAGVEVVSSGDLIQRFEATWDDEQWAMHREAERFTTAAYDLAWDFIRRKVQGGGSDVGVRGPVPRSWITSARTD